MKPLNLDNSPCSPVSSNCVIWQGPNIDCISLCTGDSISTVIYNLATELCTIMNQLDLTNLDLACLKVGTNPPETFSELIQLLINKICNTPTGSNLPAAITDPCPTNCIVPIAECFQSGTQTTMLLLDYVQMIGEKVCSLVDQIDTINTNITNIDKRVTILENKPDPEPYELPPLLVDCTLADGSIVGGNSYRLDLVLLALINDDNHGYCALLSSLGQPGNVTSAYQFQSTTVGNYIGTTGASASLANCGNPLQSEYTSWTATPLNLSDSFKNLWIAVSDIRRAHKTYEVINVTGDTSVNITTTTADTACGKKDTVTVSANLPIVAQGDNITVTPTTVSNVTTYTIAGKETIVQQGANITVTQTGPTAGDTTYTVATKGVTAVATSSITTTVDSTGPNHVVSASVNDTGWVNLLGFSFYTGESASEYQPKCRRVGNMIFFRGIVMIPLSSDGNGSGTAVPWEYAGTYDTYASNTTVSPLNTSTSADSNACVVNNQGSLQFNRGASVIPTNVTTLNFENLIQTNYTTAQRYAVDADGESFILSSVIKVWITKDKRLVLQYLRDNEYSSGGESSASFYTSPYNILNTIVTSGERISKWNNGGISSTTAAAGAAYNLQANAASPATRTATFSCDPSIPGQTGGFGWISLDGLVASVAPCNTDIKTLTCP